MTIAESNRAILRNAITKGLESNSAQVSWAPMQNGRQMVRVEFNEGTKIILPYSDFNAIALTAKYKKRTLGKFVIV